MNTAIPPEQRRLFASLVPIVCPPEVTELGIAMEVVAQTEASLTSFSPPVRAALSVGLLSYDQGARFWRRGRGGRAADLNSDLAAAYFASWWESRLMPRRRLAATIKSLLCMAAYQHPAMRTSIGYTPEAWIEKVRRARLAAHAPAIAQQELRVLEPDPLR
jgi:hypothetical protein